MFNPLCQFTALMSEVFMTPKNNRVKEKEGPKRLELLCSHSSQRHCINLIALSPGLWNDQSHVSFSWVLILPKVCSGKPSLCHLLSWKISPQPPYLSSVFASFIHSFRMFTFKTNTFEMSTRHQVKNTPLSPPTIKQCYIQTHLG